MSVLDQAGPGAAKRGFGCESVNRLKTTCGRPGNPSWISRKSCPVCIRDMLSETIHEFECHRAIQGCFWGFSDRNQAQKHALGVCGPSECAGDLQEWFSYKFGKIWFLKIVRPDPVERFSVRISAENHVLLVLESHMVHNRSKTTCNLPGTLVGHSKITISLLNSAWFARYSGFLRHTDA